MAMEGFAGVTAIDTRLGFTVRVNCLVAETPLESVTFAVNGNGPNVVGVPANVPEEFRVTPSTVAGVELKERVPVPPVALIGCE